MSFLDGWILLIGALTTCREHTHLNNPTFLISAYINITRQSFHLVSPRNEDFLSGLSGMCVKWKEIRLNEEFLMGNVGPRGAVKTPLERP